MPNAEYDDDLLVRLIAEGGHTYGQIAAAAGLSESFVGQVVRGETRADLQPKIAATIDGYREQAKALGARLAGVAMARLGTLAAADSKAAHETQRKASVDILKFAIGDPSKPETNINQSQQQSAGPDLTALSPDLKAKVLGELGGPGE